MKLSSRRQKEFLMCRDFSGVHCVRHIDRARSTSPAIFHVAGSHFKSFYVCFGIGHQWGCISQKSEESMMGRRAIERNLLHLKDSIYIMRLLFFLKTSVTWGVRNNSLSITLKKLFESCEVCDYLISVHLLSKAAG